MARADFIGQLRELGYKVDDRGNGTVTFGHVIPAAVFVGREIRPGVQAGEDFPLNPPSGPHVSPFLRPLVAGGTHPTGGIMDSPLGGEWQYWSRPFVGWNATNRTVRAYMAHIRNLFA